MYDRKTVDDLMAWRVRKRKQVVENG